MTFRIENQKELQAIISSLEIQFDIINDTLCEELPWTADQIRKLTIKSDEEISLKIKEWHESVNNKANMLLSIQKLLVQLKNQSRC